MTSGRLAAAIAACLVCVAGTPAGALAAARAHGRHASASRVHAVPALQGVKVRLAGRTFVTGRDGTIVVPPGLLANPSPGGGGSESDAFPRDTRVGSVRRPHGGIARFDRFYDGQIAMADYYRFRPRFTGIGGRPVDPRLIQGYRLKSRLGAVIDVKGAAPVTLKSSRVVRYSSALLSKPIEWSVESVTVDGANVVQRASVRFAPSRLTGPLTVPLLFFQARITSKDALFGFPIGNTVVLTLPSGGQRRLPLGNHSSLTLPALPRGEYKVKVEASGLAPERPVALSRSQVVDLKVVSWLDLALAGALLSAIAVGLLLARRPHMWRLPRRRARRRPAAGGKPAARPQSTSAAQAPEAVQALVSQGGEA